MGATMEQIKLKNKYEVLTDVQVIKQGGQIVRFRVENIRRILAILVSDDILIEELMQEIIDNIDQNIITTEIISENVYNTSINAGLDLQARQYKEKALSKRAYYQEQLNVQTKLDQFVGGDKQVLNENANKDSRVYNTTRDLTAGVSAKAIGLRMLPKKVANAHLKGDVHYHDLDYHPYSPMTNCCLIDFEEMLQNGFHIGNAEVESPKSINTASAQIAQIVANVASSQYGGCSADRIDEVLAPYAELNYHKHLKEAKKWLPDEEQHEPYALAKTKKDIYDAMQSLEYEINTLYSSNGQTPFTTLGFGLGTNWFEREIQKAILQVRIGGLGREKRTAIFPKLVFTLKKGLNLEKEDPNYDIKQLAIECATKRMYPDVLMYDKLIELTGSFKAPMGCRSFLQGWKNDDNEEVNSGRMNLGVVTLNIPRIAIQANGDQEAFWEILEERLSIAEEALVYRVARCKDAEPENAPILYQHGAFGTRLAKDEDVDSLFKGRRATVSLGYIGLYEAATCFFGPNWEHSKEAKEFTIDILKVLKQHTDQWGDKYDYHFSVYATPSESLTDRFNRLDRKKYGSIEHITNKEYYTNSFHYDVRKDPTPFEKIAFESEYAPYTSGGFIHYCEYPNLRQNPKALEAVWDYAYDLVGYLGTNTPIDQCYECGFKGDFEPTAHGFKCPQCHNTNPETCDVVKRTCGYLGNPQIRPMVKGRHKEIASRVKHLHLDDDVSELLKEDSNRALNKETRMRILSHLDKY